MKDKYIFALTSELHGKHVKIKIFCQKNDNDPFECGRLVMSPAEWDLFEAMLWGGPSRFLDSNVTLRVHNPVEVKNAISETKPWIPK